MTGSPLPPRQARSSALPPLERAIYATTLYAGLRLGELQALDWRHVDLDQNLISIERSWDRHAGFVVPKSRCSVRRVPITPPSAANSKPTGSAKAQAASGSSSPATPAPAPFNPGTVALHTWANAGLAPIGLHECRHSYAAYMIAAGVNTKALSTYLGHASITITIDRYGHLLPGNETEAANLLETWLNQAVS